MRCLIVYSKLRRKGVARYGLRFFFAAAETGAYTALPRRSEAVTYKQYAPATLACGAFVSAPVSAALVFAGSLATLACGAFVSAPASAAEVLV